MIRKKSDIHIDENKNNEKNRDIINKSLLIAFSVLLSNSKLNNINFEQYKEKAINVMKDYLKNVDYQNSISKATGDERNIRTCLDYSLEVLKKCGIINQ